MSMYVYTRLNVCLYVSVQVSYLYMHMWILVYMCECFFMYTCIYKYTCVHLFVGITHLVPYGSFQMVGCEWIPYFCLFIAYGMTNRIAL